MAEEVDVVVIGSGLGGLSCAALLASRGLTVSVLEAHYEIGGCAHEFSVGLDGRTVPYAALERLKAKGDPLPPLFKFEAGPSLYSGMSPDKSPNPLKHVYQMIGEEPEWITYDLWGSHLVRLIYPSTASQPASRPSSRASPFSFYPSYPSFLGFRSFTHPAIRWTGLLGHSPERMNSRRCPRACW